MRDPRRPMVPPIPLRAPVVGKNDQSEQINLQQHPPDSCVGCGYKPEEETKTAWLQLRNEGPVWFYACPKCFSLYVTKDAASNIEKFQAAVKRVQDRANSPLIIPQMGIRQGRKR